MTPTFYVIIISYGPNKDQKWRKKIFAVPRSIAWVDRYGFWISSYNFQPIWIILFAFSSQSDGLTTVRSEFWIFSSDQNGTTWKYAYQKHQFLKIFFKIRPPPFCFEKKIKILIIQKLVHPIVKRMQKELSKSVKNCRRRSKNRKSLPRKKITEKIANKGFSAFFRPFIEKQPILTFPITFFTCTTLDNSGGTKWACLGPNVAMLGPKMVQKGRENGVGRHHF